MYRVAQPPPPEPPPLRGVHRLGITSRGCFLPLLAALTTLVSGALAFPAYVAGSLSPFYARMLRDVFARVDDRLVPLGLAMSVVLWGLVVFLFFRPIHHLRIDLNAKQLQFVSFGRVVEETPLTEWISVSVEHESRQDRWDNRYSPTRGASVVRKTSTFNEYRVRVTGLTRDVFWTTNRYAAERRADLIRRLCRIPAV
jgi:hypothetical protein